MNTRKLMAYRFVSISVAMTGVWGCDTRLQTGGPTETHDAGFEAALAPMTDRPSALPIPSTPEFICDDGQNFQLQLPCQVGMAPLHFLECPMSGRSVRSGLSGHGGGEPIGILDLSGIFEAKNAPLPLADAVPVVGPSLSMTISRDGTPFVLGAFAGSVAFYTVDLQARGFLGRFIDASFIFKATSGEQIVCRNDQGLFWAVAGNFL